MAKRDALGKARHVISSRWKGRADPNSPPHLGSSVHCAFSSNQRSISLTGISRSFPRRTIRTSGCTWRSNELIETPSARAASARVMARRPPPGRRSLPAGGGLRLRMLFVAAIALRFLEE